MPYSKTTWVEGTTGITAARLNNIESGVEVGFNNAIQYAVAIGSANAYIITLNPAPTTLAEGMCIAVKINIDSTSISTINVNGLGAKGIKKANGNDVTNFKSGGIYTLRYNGSNFQLLGEGGEYGIAGASDVKVGISFGTENGVATGTFTSDATAVANDIIASKTAYANGNKVTGTIPDRGAGGTKTPTASNITLSAGRYTTDIVIAGVSVPAANVLTGTTIAGQVGTMPNASGDTASLANSISGTTLKLRASKGYRDGVDDNVTITDANFIAGNIPNTKSIFGMQGTLEHIDINGIIASYNVLSGTINAGDFVSYVNTGALTAVRSNAVIYLWATQLDTNKILLVFADESTYYGQAVVLTISGTTITPGSVFTFNSYGCQYYSVCALSSTKAIAAWVGAGNTSVRGRVLTISGTTVSAGTELYLHGDGSGDLSYQYVNVTALDSTRAVVAWHQANNTYGIYQGQAIILNAPATTLTTSNVLAFDGAGGSYVNVCKVDTGKVVVAYGASGYVYAKVLAIGAGVTWGTHGSAQQWEGGPSNFSTYFSMDMLSAGKIIIVYGNNGYCNTKIFTITSTSIAFGTLYSFDTTGTTVRNPRVTMLDASNAAVAYDHLTSASNLVATLLSISGTVITKGTRTVLSTWSNTGQYAHIGIAKSDSNTPVVFYRNTANSNYCTGVVLPKNSVKKAASPDVTLGIATTGGTAGVSISVKKAY